MANEIARPLERDVHTDTMPLINFGDDLQVGRSSATQMEPSPYIPGATIGSDYFNFEPIVTEPGKYTDKVQDIPNPAKLSHADALDLAMTAMGAPHAEVESNTSGTTYERRLQTVDQGFDAQERAIAESQWNQLSKPERVAVHRESMAAAREAVHSSSEVNADDFRTRYPNLSTFMDKLRLATTSVEQARANAHADVWNGLTEQQQRQHQEQMRIRRHTSQE